MAYATAREIAVDSIPIVDIAPLVARDAAGSAAAGDAMREASERIGFFYIAGHGVPDALTASVFSTAAAFFEPHFARPLARGSAIWFPCHGREQFGVPPHTGYGGLTLLALEMTGGLQVKGTRHEWVMVQTVPGTLVVNIGDLMHRRTNGRPRSNPHRVVNNSGRARQSAAVFFDASFHAVIDPTDLPDDLRAAKYPPIACGEWVVGKFDKAFTYRAPG